MKTVSGDWYRVRITGAIIIILAAFGLLTARLYQLQVLSGTQYRRLSDNNSIRLETLDPSRGLIMDRDGTVVADDRPSFDIQIMPRDARPLDQVTEMLCGILGWDAEKRSALARKVKESPPFKPVPVALDVDRDTLAVIEARRFEMPGVVVQVKAVRHYPFGTMACHLIGYLSEINKDEMESGAYPNRKPGAFIGKYGVEKSYEDHLAGRYGGRQVEVDARGRLVSIISTVPPAPGNNVILTLDTKLQKKAEELLTGQTGAVVAVEPDTGRVLAMASSPAFDPNLFAARMRHEDWGALIKNPERPLRNKAITARYPPGSTYKPLVALAGLEEGVISAGTVHYCPGHYWFAGRDYRCWKKGGHGGMEVIQAVAQSCDVYFYKTGEALGVDRLAFYARAAGLGQVSGIELGEENPGLVPTSEWKRQTRGVPWMKGETLSISIGQGFMLATPLQMALMTAAIGNGGTLYKPQVVLRVESPEGEPVLALDPRPAGRLPVSRKNLELVRRGMWEVVNGARGTARVAKLPDIGICGKTGTAQVVGRGGRDKFLNQTNKERKFKDHAWFISYAPAGHPKIACAVLVEHGEHGSSSASPIARDMTNLYLNGVTLNAGAGAEGTTRTAGAGAAGLTPGEEGREEGVEEEEGNVEE
jgi:penicillin-binding protein 2